MSTYNIDLTGQIAFITGGFRGIGGACTRLFSEAGAQCVITGRRPLDEDIETFADEIEKLYGTRPYYIQADIGNEEAVKSSVKEAGEKFGHIDILIGNAGGAFTFDENIRNNIYGTNWLWEATYPYLAKAEKGGKAVFISSSCIIYGGHGYQDPSYIAGKAGEEALCKLYARNGAKDGIRVNCVLPGPTLSEGMAEMNGGKEIAREKYDKQMPLGFIGETEDLAGVCLFLCSDLSKYLTAQTYNVDGGRFLVGY